MMRLVFVNHAHPDIPHVSGMRLGHFANAMARRGHDVILLTASLPDHPLDHALLRTGAEDLDNRDRAFPLVIPVTPAAYWPIEMVRQRSLPSPLRRGLTAWSFLRHGGVFPDWTLAAKSTALQIAQAFRPNVVWGTFGNTSNLWLAQYIASQGRCPWVMDVKDNWEAFVPPGLRRLMAKRYSDAAGITFNARHHQHIAKRWLRTGRTKVIYSGVAEPFFAAPEGAVADRSRHEILLVGGTYDEARVSEFVQAMSRWLLGLTARERDRIVFVYAGSDRARVSAVLKKSPLPCRVEVNAQLPLEQFASRCKSALANCYLWAPFGFHHKLLELLVAGAPVIVYPGEHDESLSFSRASGTPFHVCPNAAALNDALSQVWKRKRAHVGDGAAPPWRWDDFAEDLECFFEQVRH